MNWKATLHTILAVAVGGAAGVIETALEQGIPQTGAQWKHLGLLAFGGALLAVAGLWVRKPTDPTPAAFPVQTGAIQKP